MITDKQNIGTNKNDHTGFKTILGGKVILIDLDDLANVIEDEIIKKLA